MMGKGSLIVVFSFVVAISAFQNKLNRSVISTYDNYNYYYIKSLIHENSISAMNMGINEVWANSTTNANFMVTARNCTSNVVISPVGLDTVQLSVNSWGYTYEEGYFAKHKKRFKMQDSVYAFFAYGIPISRYFWFTNSERGVYWITGDTVRGPVHTNGYLKTSGSPVFYGKVSANGGISPRPWKKRNKAKFYGGWEIGNYIEIPTDMTHLQNAANAGNGGAPMNTKSLYDKKVQFEFLPSGNVKRKVGTGSWETVALSDIAPTGVIYSTKDVRVKGTLNGQVTIYSARNVWIDDDVVYADDPSANPSSDDYLGLVAKNYIYVTDNAANNSDVNIQASIMSINRSFTAQNYSSRPVAGVLRVTGSIVQKNRGPVGTFSWWSGGIVSGFSKRYNFDKRLASASAPYYPFVRMLRLVAWWE